MIADKRRKPSRARQKAAREERERVRAEQVAAMKSWTLDQIFRNGVL